jgi:glutathione S-transferase
MGKPLLYGMDYSVYVQIAKLALVEKQVEYEHVPVSVFAAGGPPDWYVDLHPFKRMPAFEHDGFQLYETQAILRYIDEGFPVAPLQPTDLHQFARMNQIMGIVDAYAWRAIAAGIVFPRLMAPRLGLPVDEGAVAKAVPQVRLCLGEFARLMGDQPYMAGERISLADLMVVPLLYYLARVPEGEAPIAEHPSLRAWMRRIEDRQSFQVTKPPGL